MRQSYYLYFAVFLIFYSIGCKKPDNSFSFTINNNELKISLYKHSDTLYALKLYVDDSLNSEWPLRYPVYRFDFGDVNNDGVPDILVGTIKSTRYDPKLDKRLFIYRITKDYYIRPLWLGSRVSQPLVDFKLMEDTLVNKIRTIEKEQNGTFLVADYSWKGFGLKFEKYIKRNIPEEKAYKELEPPKSP